MGDKYLHAPHEGDRKGSVFRLARLYGRPLTLYWVGPALSLTGFDVGIRLRKRLPTRSERFKPFLSLLWLPSSLIGSCSL
jgi:hypothetical protein